VAFARAHNAAPDVEQEKRLIYFTRIAVREGAHTKGTLEHGRVRSWGKHDEGQGEHVPVKAHLLSGGAVPLSQANAFGLAGATGQRLVRRDGGTVPRIDVCVEIMVKAGGERPAAD